MEEMPIHSSHFLVSKGFEDFIARNITEITSVTEAKINAVLKESLWQTFSTFFDAKCQTFQNFFSLGTVEGRRRSALLLMFMVIGALSFKILQLQKVIDQLMTEVAVHEPKRLIIPAINVDAPIEARGQTLTGEMDVPGSAKSVAWYRYGAKPGAVGNAVLAGHLDTIFYNPAVFWDLKKLQAGDEVLVEDKNGTIRHFRTERTEIYASDKAPLEEIFGSTDAKHLNLITCSGVWNWFTGSYDERVVVYTKLIEP